MDRLKKRKKAILCFIGWHSWTWKYERGTTLFLDAPPPDHATCERCEIRFKPEVGECNVCGKITSKGDESQRLCSDKCYEEIINSSLSEM